MLTLRSAYWHFYLFRNDYACLPLCGCFHLGPDRLEQDEIGYSPALGDSQNQQMRWMAPAHGI
jgi:hypothetical protein